MRAHFGKKACETELFRAALRRLFLFIRLGAAATAFTQDRPIPDARRPVLDACREIVKAWSQTFAPAGAGENAHIGFKTNEPQKAEKVLTEAGVKII